MMRIVDGWDRFRAILPHESDARINVLLHELVDDADCRLGLQQAKRLIDGLEPRVNQGLKTNRARLHVDHTTARYRGGGGHRQVLDFEHHSHLVGKRDDLTRVETKLLVVIEHSVH